MSKNNQPIIDETVFVAEGARIIGDVEIGAHSSVWYNAVLRGDASRIVVGENTNIQDNAVLHGAPGFPTTVGDNVTIGHGAIVHGCTIGSNSLVGMGAIILNGATIGENSIVGAGALVTEGVEIPANSVAFGSPARPRRAMVQRDVEGVTNNARVYVERAREALEDEG